MKRCVVGGLAALVLAAGLIDSAPPARAGCVDGGPAVSEPYGPVLSKCDGPVQPDGTWQRCVATTHLSYQGASSFLIPEKSCDVMGPDQHPGGFGFADPPPPQSAFHSPLDLTRPSGGLASLPPHEQSGSPADT